MLLEVCLSTGHRSRMGWPDRHRLPRGHGSGPLAREDSDERTSGPAPESLAHLSEHLCGRLICVCISAPAGNKAGVVGSAGCWLRPLLKGLHPRMWASEPESDRAQGELLPGPGRPRDARARAETFPPLPPLRPALSLQTHKKEIEWLRGRCTSSKTEAQPGSAEAWPAGRLPLAGCAQALG